MSIEDISNNHNISVDRDISLYVSQKELERQLKLSKLQEYIPISDCFSEKNPLERNSLQLDNIEVEDMKERLIKQNNVTMFCKYAPLVDPVKYMVGKYEIDQMDILPSKNGVKGIPTEKINRRMNSAYIDALFCSLSKENNNFTHGIEYYGCYLGIKEQFFVNIEDDIHILSESEFFHDQNDKLFTLNFNIHNDIMASDNLKNESNKNKSKLNIEDSICLLDNIETLPYIEISNTSTETNTRLRLDTPNLIETHFEETDVKETIQIESDNDTSSVITTISNDENENDDIDDEDDSDSNEEFSESDISTINSDLSSETDDCEIEACINKFPVALILLERCNETLEHYINDRRSKFYEYIESSEDCNNISENEDETEHNSEISESSKQIIDITNEEWKSILFQIIISLTYYQKHYNFTHNDLHSCNIMYKNTDEKYLHYKYNNQYYKVPTFGKIYKIIDFGRSIFTYNNNIFSSDSFGPGEDAHTQYNCEPFFNENKPRLEPNMSFDLCRLGCSLFDYFFDELGYIDEIIQDNPVASMVYNWTVDNQGRNVLYRKNGEERYPDFKLYKMISRNVHNHIPKNEIQNSLFDSFKLEIENEDLISDIIHI